MKLYIIRHGQTDWNVEGKIQGRQDIPLNAAGRSQAEMLAKGMEKRPVTAPARRYGPWRRQRPLPGPRG